ncbi:hypothetical protein MED222_13560 [Vibrio sp. MED222]|nr:hypothetical protein MED222_13560 [Vibrio sp. MED222]
MFQFIQKFTSSMVHPTALDNLPSYQSQIQDQLCRSAIIVILFTHHPNAKE